jgi:hypothetical protein
MSQPRPILAAYLRQFPELRMVDNPAVARQAIRAVRRTTLFMVETWVLAIGAIVVALVLGSLAALLLNRLGVAVSSTELSASLTCVALGLLPFVINRMTSRVRRYKLRHWLWAHGYPTCLKCGYNLTGNQSSQCPECGTAAPGDETHGHK